MIENGPITPPPNLPRRLKLWVGALLVALFAALSFALVGRIAGALEEREHIAEERAAASARAAEPTRVRVARPQLDEVVPRVVLTGTLEPVQSADLSFEVSGRIATVRVRLGETVAENQVLASLDRSSVGVEAAQSEAAIDVARANVDMLRDRVRLLQRLTSSGASSERELTTATQELAVTEAQLRQAEAARHQVRSSLRDHLLRAPFAGVVTRVPSGTGGVSAPGATVIRVEDLTALRLRTTVSRAELELVSLGDEVSVLRTLSRRRESGARGSTGSTGQAAAGGPPGLNPVAGRVVGLVRSLDRETRRAPLEILVPNPEGRLVANALVRAHIRVGGPVPVLRIPAEARRPDGTVLLVGDDQKLVARTVDATVDDDGSWLVRAGLDSTDQVAVRAAGLSPGQPVSLMGEDESDGRAQ